MASRILVLTNDSTDAATLKNVLVGARDGPFETEWLTGLSAALERLRSADIDAILVDLSLSDSTGIGTFDALFGAAPHTPIMILSAREEEAEAIEAVQRGAQGYLSKGYFKSSLMPQSLRSMIQRMALERELYKEKARAEIALASIGDAVLCTDTSGKVDYLNAAAEKLTGWSNLEAHGQPVGAVLALVNSVTRATQINTVEQVLEQNKAMRLPADTLLVRRNGSEVPIEDSAAPIHDLAGHLAGSVVVFHDVSILHAMNMKMIHLAHHDFLTNLPNRLLLNDRIAQALILAKRHGTKLAVLFLDLDNFKHTNDSLGHAIGDELLQSVAQRLCTCVRGSDTVSRQGGDEFVILLSEYHDENDVASVADKIVTMLALPHSIAKHALHVTSSVGVSVYPADGEDAETLIKNADTAMYHAKEKGRNNYQFFRNDMNIRAFARRSIETNLRRALEKHEFILHYQPKVNLDTGMITGAEALLRWKHSEWGMVLPESFIPIAEECGLIVPIGHWVLREACAQAMRWRQAGLPAISMAVNISAVEFRQKNFLEGVNQVLNETGLEAPCLQLEITEGVLMRDANASTAILQKLKTRGVELAVDDFGTGYSSLSYLKQFPIDVLKIDQSFVHGVASAKDDGIIVSAVIGMGNSLNLRVIAEGVENQAQLAFLKARNCEEGQGYLFSRPLVAEQFGALLASERSATLSN